MFCTKVIGGKEKQTIGTAGLSAIEEKATVWAKVKVPRNDEPYQEFTCVEERIRNKNTKTFEVHPTCRLKFRTLLERKQKKYGLKEDTEVAEVDVLPEGDENEKH